MWFDIIAAMLSTVPISGASNHNMVRRPALFLSPYSMTSTSSASSRAPSTPSGSPSLPPRLQQQQSTTSSLTSTTPSSGSSSHNSSSDSPGTPSTGSEVRIAVLGLLGVGKSGSGNVTLHLGDHQCSNVNYIIESKYDSIKHHSLFKTLLFTVYGIFVYRNK